MRQYRIIKHFAMAFLLAVALAGCERTTRQSLEEAQAFMKETESRLLTLWIKTGRAAWIQSSFITADTNALAALANKEMISFTTELAHGVGRFNALDLPEELERKIRLLKTSVTAFAPVDPVLQQELSEVMANIKSIYDRGEYCRSGEEKCLDLSTMKQMFAEERGTDDLLEIWKGWREVSREIRPLYERFVELSNVGAQELGFKDLGDKWRSSYDMPTEEFKAELERLWKQVRPLYVALHCHVRSELADQYGTAVVARDEPIPAHILGNMWSQSWSNIYDQVSPPTPNLRYDLTQLLRRQRVNEVEMVRYGERFFTSLGFEPLPPSFWERSLFIKPVDRDVVCGASAWNLDFDSDIRIKMCINVTGEDFVKIHQVLSHNYYQRSYGRKDPLYRAGANDGFHGGVGDAIELSITPMYLARIGLLNQVPSSEDDIALLLHKALDKIALLPFSLLVDQWRWRVSAGEITPDAYNEQWWTLRREYQGIRPPVPRNRTYFDPGAKYDVTGNMPHTRYFLALILQFQFHRALCEAAGVEAPLHQCSIFESSEAGNRLKAMLELGASRPWPDALEVITGTRTMDATAILDYFEPLTAWLDEQNTDTACGWSL